MFGPVIILLTMCTVRVAPSKKWMLEFDVPGVINDIAKITGLGDNLVSRVKNMPDNLKLEVETPNMNELLRSVGNYMKMPYTRKSNLINDLSSANDDLSSVNDDLRSINNDEIDKPNNNGNILKDLIKGVNLTGIMGRIGKGLQQISEGRKRNDAKSDENPDEPKNDGNILEDLVKGVNFKGIMDKIGKGLQQISVGRKRNVIKDHKSDGNSNEDISNENNYENLLQNILEGVNLTKIVSDIRKGLNQYITIESIDGPNQITNEGDINIKAQLNYGNHKGSKQKSKKNSKNNGVNENSMKTNKKHNEYNGGIENNMKTNKKGSDNGMKIYRESLRYKSKPTKNKFVHGSQNYNINRNNNNNNFKKYARNSDAYRRFLDNTIGEKYYTYPEMAPGIYKTRVIEYPPYYHQNRVRALLEIMARNEKLKHKWKPG